MSTNSDQVLLRRDIDALQRRFTVLEKRLHALGESPPQQELVVDFGDIKERLANLQLRMDILECAAMGDDAYGWSQPTDNVVPCGHDWSQPTEDMVPDSQPCARVMETPPTSAQKNLDTPVCPDAPVKKKNTSRPTHWGPVKYAKLTLVRST